MADSINLGLRNGRKRRKKTEKGQSKMDSFVKRPRTLEPSVSDMASCSNAEPLEEQVQEELAVHDDCHPTHSSEEEEAEEEVSVSPSESSGIIIIVSKV